MKFSYYDALCEQAERIQKMSQEGADLFKLGQESRLWQEVLVDRLFTDFLPPIERRDLLSIVQSIGYIAYEMEQLMRCRRLNSPAGVLLMEKLKPCLAVLSEQTKLLQKRRSCATALRKQVYALLSVWRDCLKTNEEPLLLDGFEAVADTVLRYADLLEAVMVTT